jgi:hypothetical protein
VPLIQRKTAEEKVARTAQKQADREAKAREKLRRKFFGSPAGQARVAFEGGAQVFQYEADVKAMKALVNFVGPTGGTETLLSRLAGGPVATLNTVADEGWELVNGSFVFLETGQVSRDKFMSSGQQVAVAGKVVGYYLFKRNEALKKHVLDPWDVSDAEAVELADQIE